jgi:hypothetical protein
MRRLLLPAFLSILILAPAVRAEEAPKPDDRVVIDLAAEDWVTTKTARVTANVEAAVSAANAGSARADMIKAVGGLAAGEWRLVGFNRSQDQTGLERWSASFEARLPEASLGGLNDNAKKLSKAGMQVSVGEIDFSPTLDETETARAALRAQIYKKAADQLTALNGVLTGRGYRIASIDFGGGQFPMPMPGVMAGGVGGRMMPMVAAAATSIASPDSAGVEERSQKVTMTARVVYAALPPMPDAKH